MNITLKTALVASRSASGGRTSSHSQSTVAAVPAVAETQRCPSWMKKPKKHLKLSNQNIRKPPFLSLEDLKMCFNASGPGHVQVIHEHQHPLVASRSKSVLDPLFDLALNDLLRLASHSDLIIILSCLPEDVIADMLMVKDVQVASSKPAMASPAGPQHTIEPMHLPCMYISRLYRTTHHVSVQVSSKDIKSSSLLDRNGLASTGAAHQKAVEMLRVQRLQDEHVSCVRNWKLCQRMYNIYIVISLPGNLRGA